MIFFISILSVPPQELAMYAYILKKNTRMENVPTKTSSTLGFDALKMILEYDNIYSMPSHTLEHVKPSERNMAEINMETERTLLLKIAKTIHKRNTEYNKEVHRFSLVVKAIREKFGSSNVVIDYLGNANTYEFPGAANLFIHGITDEWCTFSTEAFINYFGKKIEVQVFRGIYEQTDYHAAINFPESSRNEYRRYRKVDQFIQAVAMTAIYKKKTLEALEFPRLPTRDTWYILSLPESIHEQFLQQSENGREMRRRLEEAEYMSISNGTYPWRTPEWHYVHREHEVTTQPPTDDDSSYNGYSSEENLEDW